MDWNANLGLILGAAFGIGALHALEPGHGKSIMGAYLVASRGGVRHAILLGLVVTITHTIVVFMLALATLQLAQSFASAVVVHWLELASAVLILLVGAWLVVTSFGFFRRRPGRHPHVHRPGGGHADAHPHTRSHDHAHGHTHEVRIPPSRDPLSVWTLVGVGASGGLVPCPAALTALLAAVNLGRPAAGIAVVGAMSFGIATALIAIGILFVQAGRLAEGLFGGHGILAHAPRISAIVITLLGLGLLARAVLDH